MVQTWPLPGSYRHAGEPLGDIVQEAVEEASLLAACGFDGIILQNMGDMPIHQRATVESVAYLTVVAKEIRAALPQIKLGILVNWDGAASLAVAHAIEADFIRVEHVYTGLEVTSAGLLHAQCCEILALRKKLGADIPILADVYEIHGVPLGAKPIEDAAWESVREAFAEGLFLMGKTAEESIEMAEKVRTRLPDTPLFLGGGANADNVAAFLQHYDGVCIATWIKNGNMQNPVDPVRARQFVQAVADATADGGA